ncbi:hypothetical protein [Modestobacter sp. VKM Ac-2978]|uniref:hypothetical protein n=1 Tax=Modestobacter sp. VKM Ac-2978 TaxID=3004132 RepID=UPI0022AAB7D8|nr:hypothetical protein [Modestobacter sp. VKM Ac-2978]MCZ2850007.1 hypothetical protein [Modestobacter sp. VKM Ac-2978]
MSGKTVHVLLVYSYAEGKLMSQQEFSDRRQATEAYNAAEEAFREKSGYEIVLVGSDSIQTIMQTHGHYFMRSDERLFSELLTSSLDS